MTESNSHLFTSFLCFCSCELWLLNLPCSPAPILSFSHWNTFWVRVYLIIPCQKGDLNPSSLCLADCPHYDASVETAPWLQCSSPAARFFWPYLARSIHSGFIWKAQNNLSIKFMSPHHFQWRFTQQFSKKSKQLNILKISFSVNSQLPHISKKNIFLWLTLFSFFEHQQNLDKNPRLTT